MFIVIDGIDGSGKGTQTKILVNKLLSLGKTVKVLDYPRYGEPAAFAVEKYLNGEYGTDLTAKQASVFYALDRFDHSMQLKKDLESYDYVISNRYVSASMIHQTGKIADYNKRQEFLDWLYELEYNIFNIAKPDKTIFLNVSPEMSQRLVLKKDDREYLKWDMKMDIHEADKEHLSNAHSAALEIVAKYPDWIEVVCQNETGEMKSIETIHGEILNIVL